MGRGEGWVTPWSCLNRPDCAACCTNCCLLCTVNGSREQPATSGSTTRDGCSLGTPRTLNMVLRLGEAFTTSTARHQAPAASPSLVHHAQTSAEPPGSHTFIFLSCLGFLFVCFASLPSILPLFHSSPPLQCASWA